MPPFRNPWSKSAKGKYVWQSARDEVSVFVSKNEHPAEVSLMRVGKPTLWGEGIGLSKRTKQAIPPSDVSIIISVDVQLMMDRMMLRSLKYISNPMRSA
jgi:hypothetical protein